MWKVLREGYYIAAFFESPIMQKRRSKDIFTTSITYKNVQNNISKWNLDLLYNFTCLVIFNRYEIIAFASFVTGTWGFQLESGELKKNVPSLRSFNFPLTIHVIRVCKRVSRWWKRARDRFNLTTSWIGVNKEREKNSNTIEYLN